MKFSSDKMQSLSYGFRPGWIPAPAFTGVTVCRRNDDFRIST